MSTILYNKNISINKVYMTLFKLKSTVNIYTFFIIQHLLIKLSTTKDNFI